MAEAQDPRELALLDQVSVITALLRLEENVKKDGLTPSEIITLVAVVVDPVVGQGAEHAHACMLQ